MMQRLCRKTSSLAAQRALTGLVNASFSFGAAPVENIGASYGARHTGMALAVCAGGPGFRGFASGSEDRRPAGAREIPAPKDVSWVDEAAASNRELQKSLRVAVIGAPNAGKSTLVNSLVGEQISAVSHKTNTTRTEMLGAVTHGDTQLVFYDTPGVVSVESIRSGGHTSRVTSAWRAAARADVLLFVIDAERQAGAPDPRVERLIANVSEELERVCMTRVSGVPPPPSVLVLNKVDLLPRPVDLIVGPLSYDLGKLHTFEAHFSLSALTERGTEKLQEFLRERAVQRPWDVPPERATDRSQAAQALEIVREAMFGRLHQELPYTVRIQHVSWQPLADGSVRIEQALMVASHSQRKLVVGSGGATIGQLGIAARKRLEKLFGRRVHLFLRVKIAEGPGRRSRDADGASSGAGGGRSLRV